MTFRLITDADGSYEQFDDGASYRFNGAGLLVIEDEEGTRRTYSPRAWVRIDEPNPKSGHAYFRPL